MIAVVELIEQPNLKLITNIVDTELDAIEIGAEVQVTWRQLDDEFTLPVFRPVALKPDRHGRGGTCQAISASR